MTTFDQELKGWYALFRERLSWDGFQIFYQDWCAEHRVEMEKLVAQEQVNQYGASHSYFLRCVFLLGQRQTPPEQAYLALGKLFVGPNDTIFAQEPLGTRWVTFYQLEAVPYYSVAPQYWFWLPECLLELSGLIRPVSAGESLYLQPEPEEYDPDTFPDNRIVSGEYDVRRRSLIARFEESPGWRFERSEHHLLGLAENVDLFWFQGEAWVGFPQRESLSNHYLEWRHHNALYTFDSSQGWLGAAVHPDCLSAGSA